MPFATGFEFTRDDAGVPRLYAVAEEYATVTAYTDSACTTPIGQPGTARLDPRTNYPVARIMLPATYAATGPLYLRAARDGVASVCNATYDTVYTLEPVTVSLDSDPAGFTVEASQALGYFLPVGGTVASRFETVSRTVTCDSAPSCSVASLDGRISGGITPGVVEVVVRPLDGRVIDSATALLGVCSSIQTDGSVGCSVSPGGTITVVSHIPTPAPTGVTIDRDGFYSTTDPTAFQPTVAGTAPLGSTVLLEALIDGPYGSDTVQVSATADEFLAGVQIQVPWITGEVTVSVRACYDPVDRPMGCSQPVETAPYSINPTQVDETEPNDTRLTATPVASVGFFDTVWGIVTAAGTVAVGEKEDWFVVFNDSCACSGFDVRQLRFPLRALVFIDVFDEAGDIVAGAGPDGTQYAFGPGESQLWIRVTSPSPEFNYPYTLAIHAY